MACGVTYAREKDGAYRCLVLVVDELPKTATGDAAARVREYGAV